MKFAVLSDIHANLAALQAISEDIESWKPDFTIVNGDIINRGPLPRECWEFVQRKVTDADWVVTMGNHEEYVLNHVNQLEDKKEFPMSWWTMNRLLDYVAEIETLPASWSHLVHGGGEFRATHASMLGSRVGLNPQDPIDKVRAGIDPAPAVQAIGHIHMPYLRMVDKTMIVNSGSAGQPCYGEKKGCYAQISWHNSRWHAEIRRIAYDRASNQRSWFESGIFEATKAMTQIIYHEWRTARPFVLKWYWEYFPFVERGEIKEEEMLARFLIQENLGRPDPSDPL